MLAHLWLIPAGFLLGAFGTLIGAGGGFLLAPLLLVVYPGESAAVITSISLAVVCLNALSGSVAYARMGRVDFRSGAAFAAAATPGAILGAMATQAAPRSLFDPLFGGALLALSALLALGGGGGEGRAVRGLAADARRTIVEGGGAAHRYAFNSRLGAAVSVVVGFVSSFLGIGGGVLHVPALVRLLGFPVHVATATSHFVLAITALAGVLTHAVHGAFHHGVRRAAMLGAGALVGAQFGAHLSARVHGRWILRSLAAALALVGVRLLFF